MNRYATPDRPLAAIPPLVMTDDELVRAQARARCLRSQAFARAVRWGVDRLRRLGD